MKYVCYAVEELEVAHDWLCLRIIQRPAIAHLNQLSLGAVLEVTGPDDVDSGSTVALIESGVRTHHSSPARFYISIRPTVST